MNSASLRRREFLRRGWGSILGCAIGERAFASEKPEVEFVLEFGGHGSAPGKFDSPVGMAIDGEDQLYVTDFLNKRVQAFRTDGTFIRAFPVLPYPGGLAVDSAGTVYVAHWNDSQIAAYSPKGELLRKWGKKGTGDAEFRLVGGLAISRDQTLYAADQGNSRIQAFTCEGKFLRAWGSLGEQPGQFGKGTSPGSRFAGPQFLATDRAGSLYATDAASARVQKFTANGEFVFQFGNNSSQAGGFGGHKAPIEGPIALCLDHAGRIWVGATNHRVQLFSPEGIYLAGIGKSGVETGEFHTPHGLAVDSRGFLYVVDTMNCRIQKFAVA